MAEILKFETNYELEQQERDEKIISMYLDHSMQIVNKTLTPNRVMPAIAKEFNYTVNGIRSILQRKGIYRNAQNPIVKPKE